MKRRDFLEKSALSSALLLSSQTSSLALSHQDTKSVVPSAIQKAWMDLQFGMFIHFGINTFYDKEWSDGTLDAAAFDPRKIDTDSWCATAKRAGMKYVVITTKHHDGFCLWPSRFTDYHVGNTPFGKDVIAMLAKSARKYDLKLGLYFSLWDRYDPSYENDWWVFLGNMFGQIEELLTQYGEVTELWLDGFWKKQKNGWTKKNREIDGEAAAEERNRERDLNFIAAWRQEGAYWWQMDALYRKVKALQPACLVMNNSTTAYPGVPLHPVDIRSGEKYTEVATDQKVWKWLGEDIYLPLQIETTMSTQGNERFPSGNWFWHADDHSVRSRENILHLLNVSAHIQANLLLNVGISDEGLLRPEDTKVLTSLRG